MRMNPCVFVLIGMSPLAFFLALAQRVVVGQWAAVVQDAQVRRRHRIRAAAAVALVAAGTQASAGRRLRVNAAGAAAALGEGGRGTVPVGHILRLAAQTGEGGTHVMTRILLRITWLQSEQLL